MINIKTYSLLLFLLNSAILTQSQSINWHKLESEVTKVFKLSHSVGASVIVVDRDSILFSKGLGNSSLENHDPITDSTLFVLGSITKTFTALGILKMVEDGKLELEDEVMKLAPELSITNKWEDEFPLKVYHLLEHTSGFDELHLKDRSIPVTDDEFPLLDGLEIVKNSLKTRWKPGTRFAYSNVGYLVAGYLIEKLSGKSYNDFMHKEILRSLKMTNSSIQLNDINQNLLAKSFSSSKNELPFKHVFTRPTASLISSSREMGLFLQMLLNKGGSFLSKSTFTQFEEHHSIQAFNETKNGYKLGIYPRFHRGREWFGHGGSINKYNSEFEYNHELEVGIFVVSNGPNATKTVDGILRVFHKEFKEAEHFEKVAVDKFTNLDELSGYYIFTSPRNQLLYSFSGLFTEGFFVVFDEEQMVISKFNGRKYRLIQTGANTFSHLGYKNEYQYVFEKSNSRDVLYTSLGFSYKKTPFFWVVGLAASLIISFSFICLSQISLLIRTINCINKKYRVVNPQLTLEIGSSVLLAGCVLYLFMGMLENIHEPNILSIVLFLCTILFPLFTVLGIFQTFKYKFKHIRDKIWTFALASSMGIVSSYLIYWGFVGFEIWKY